MCIRDRANFDIKYDERDHEYKFFEINVRQGRSSFYVTLNGCNLAKCYIDDYVEDSLKDQDPVYANQDPKKHVLWLGVPTKVFKQYAFENEYKEIAEDLLKKKRVGTTVFYKADCSFKRWLLMKYMSVSYTHLTLPTN